MARNSKEEKQRKIHDQKHYKCLLSLSQLPSGIAITYLYEPIITWITLYIRSQL